MIDKTPVFLLDFQREDEKAIVYRHIDKTLICGEIENANDTKVEFILDINSVYGYKYTETLKMKLSFFDIIGDEVYFSVTDYSMNIQIND